MTLLQGELQCDELTVPDLHSSYSCACGYAADAELTVRICNDAAENGYPQEPGPLTWLNSARITTDPENDSIHLNVSVGDPRGGFHFEIRRRSDNGWLLISMPYPGESMAHEETKQVSPGTLVVVGDSGQERDFSDDEPEREDGAE